MSHEEMSDEERIEKFEQEQPWLTCPEWEFEQFLDFLRREDGYLKIKTKADGVDIEDVINAIRLRRLMRQLGGTKH